MFRLDTDWLFTLQISQKNEDQDAAYSETRQETFASTLFRVHTLFHQWFSMTFPWLLHDLYLIFHDQQNYSFSAVPLKIVYFNMEQENKVCIWNMLCLSCSRLTSFYRLKQLKSLQKNTSSVNCHFTFHYYTIQYLLSL